MENQNTELPDMANSNLETHATDVTNSQTEVESNSKTEPDVKANTDDVTEIESCSKSPIGASPRLECFKSTSTKFSRCAPREALIRIWSPV